MDSSVYLLEYIRKRKHWESVLPWLEESLFGDQDQVDVFRAISSGLKLGDNKRIDYPQIIALIREVSKDPDRWDEAEDIVKKMAKVRGKKKIISKMANRFIRQQQMLLTLQEAVALMGRGKEVHPGRLAGKLRSLEVIGESTGQVTDLYSNPAKRVETIYQASEPVPTPLEELTMVLDGGPVGGDIVTVIAVPDGGKSLLLLDVAVTASENGIPTFVAALERGRSCIARLDTRITMHTAQWLSCHPKKFIKLMGRRALKNAPLQLMDYSRRECSVSDLRRDVGNFVDTFGRIGCIVIDYGDLLRSSRRYEAKRHELDLVWVELGRLAQEFNACVWTASQSNRKGSEADMVQMNNIAESWAKAGTTDMCITLSATMREKQQSRARLFVAKTKKTGGSTLLAIKFDRLRCKVSLAGKKEKHEARKNPFDPGRKRRKKKEESKKNKTRDKRKDR